MRGDRGSATVEFALTLPAVVLVLAVLLAGARHTADAAVAREAAATAARVALVDGAAAGQRAGAAVSPGRVSVRLATDGGWWVATATLRGAGPLPDVTAVAKAYQP
ncbi:TadE/TadG family type IV pilus assembly protein [Demequina sp.]|uniref:TadE/TadG family type IV pilus assembly protein n=1 Tax=Demequina sp. TaxID=2050685 RepID=UPI003D13668C